MCPEACTLCPVNFLAHAYLSFDHEEILVGNLISDFVKGKKKFEYPVNIQKGIILHRAIDNFTDEHSATKKAKDIFRPFYRLYSAAFIDVVYDYFLANDKTEFTENSLLGFSGKVYAVLDKQINFLPPQFTAMFPYMKTQNWLFNYRTQEGIKKSFGGVVRRSVYLTESDTASLLFDRHFKELEQCYKNFFPDLKLFAFRTYEQLMNS